MTDLSGAHAIVTGASRGLGAVIAEALAAGGANLTLAARSAGDLEVVREKVEAHGVRAVAVPTDVTQAEDRTHLVAAATEALGPVDVLVNNAGLECMAWFTDLEQAEVERVVAVNLTATLLLTQLVLPGMLERRRGHIVNMASIAGKGGGPFSVVYCATKGGVVMAGEALRAELAGTGVRVSTICPGFVEDEGMYARMAAATGVRASWLMGVTTPATVAEAVVRAIRRNAPELVVTPRPLRVLTALKELFPDVGAPVVNLLVHRVSQASADQRRAERRRAPAGGTT